MSFNDAGSARLRWTVGWIAIAMLWIAAAPSSAVADGNALSFDERVTARTTMEEVRRQHRIWPETNPGPKPALETLLPLDAVRSMVADDLRKEVVLASKWGVTFTAAELQEELDRIVAASRRPDRLADLFEALGNDPLRIAECLVKPLLVDASIRSAYAWDERLHAGARSRAEKESRGISVPTSLDKIGDAYFESERGRRGSAVESLIAGTVTALQEREDRFYVLGALEQDEDRLVVAAATWNKVPFDEWWALSAPAIDLEQTGVIEGTLRLPAAPAVGCSGDSWTPTDEEPAGRFGHTAVWTGAEMIVWGGFEDILPLNDGSRYDPATDSWSALPTTGAPSGRSDHTAIWTGSEMIVWGGFDGDEPVFADGASYDPTGNSWSSLPTLDAPAARTHHTAVWSGNEMIVWGGSIGGPFYLDDGGRFDPDSGVWTSTSATDAPTARHEHTAVWIGNEMIVWGGFDGVTPYTDTGARYDPVQNSWVTLSMTGAPAGRWHHTAVSTGDEMIVWGGEGDSGSLDTGGRYSASTDSWTATTTTGAASARDTHSAVWTGDAMIVWGGWQDYSFHLDSGGSYDPLLDSWMPTSTTGTPEARYGPTAVWAETEMIVWGGVGIEFGLHSGGRYCAGLDDSIQLSVDLDDADVLLSWTAVSSATGYDVVRGSLTTLLATGGDFSAATEVCLLNDVDVVALVDNDPIGPAEAFWYLTRPVLGSGPGSYDSGGEQQIESRDAEIDLSIHACP